jgi:hypothetical protein
MLQRTLASPPTPTVGCRASGALLAALPPAPHGATVHSGCEAARERIEPPLAPWCPCCCSGGRAVHQVLRGSAAGWQECVAGCWLAAGLLACWLPRLHPCPSRTPPTLWRCTPLPSRPADGMRYGTLCVVDLKRRSFSAEMYALLINFANLVVQGEAAPRTASPAFPWQRSGVPHTLLPVRPSRACRRLRLVPPSCLIPTPLPPTPPTQPELERDAASMREVADEAAATSAGQQAIERMLAASQSECTALSTATPQLPTPIRWMVAPAMHALAPASLPLLTPSPQHTTLRPACPPLQPAWPLWMCAPAPGPCSMPTPPLCATRAPTALRPAPALAGCGTCLSLQTRRTRCERVCVCVCGQGFGGWAGVRRSLRTGPAYRWRLRLG